VKTQIQVVRRKERESIGYEILEASNDHDPYVVLNLHAQPASGHWWLQLWVLL
jgi:hypothetical protein